MSIRGWTGKAILLAGLMLAAPAGTALAEDAPKAQAGWWLPENASEHGAQIDAIFTLIFIVTVAVMILVFVFLVYLLIKYRHQTGRRVVYIHGNHKLEVIWTLTPAVLLVVMGILSLRVWADVSLNPPDPARQEVTEVEILAQQFQFNVRYPGRDGKFGTIDDLYTFDPKHEWKSVLGGLVTVPVGKPVKVYLMSKDVLHSFFLPNMRMKRDAVPGLRGVIYFTPTKTGTFDLACAELCGPQHYSMAGKLMVLPQAEYDEWLQALNDEVDQQIGVPMEEPTEEPTEEEPKDESTEPKPEETKEDPADDPEATQEATPAADQPAHSVSGRVLFDGQPPKPKVIVAATDAHCAKMHEKEPLLDESLVVGEQGGVANIFVQITGGPLQGKSFDPPAQPVVLDQQGCTYRPHIVGIQVGQTLKIVNSDDTNHNVHGVPKENKEFNLAQPKRGQSDEVKLTREEIFRIKCDVHQWMGAWAHVVSNPYHAVTDAQGEFIIADLPPGEYDVDFYHEGAKFKTEKVKVESGKAARLADLKFKPARAGARRPT